MLALPRSEIGRIDSRFLKRFQQACAGGNGNLWFRLPPLEDIPFDQFRNHRSDCDLYVPPLSEDRGVHRHVLPLHGELHRQDADLLNLGYLKSNRKGHFVAIARVPVDEHVWRRSDRPPVRKEVLCEVLKIIWLVCFDPLPPIENHCCGNSPTMKCSPK